jgi:hypothetical protein
MAAALFIAVFMGALFAVSALFELFDYFFMW